MKELISCIKNHHCFKFILAISAALLLSSCKEASAITEKIKQRLFSHHQNANQTQAATHIAMVSGVKVIRDFAYGEHKKQRLDIYTPENAKNAPVIMMLHGGAWNSGDKSDALVYINKVNRWSPKGFIIISVNTRLLPESDVYAQIEDLSQAVATAQKHATEWGGDAKQFILMGHSSAGTMVSVLAANPSLVTDLGGSRWLASYSLDSSSLDIPRTMRLWHPTMFSAAYGKAQEKWLLASPINLLSANAIPMFIACSTQRPDSPCEQAQLFAEKAQTFGLKIKISPQNLNHGEINDLLGVESEYTSAAEAFMSSLSDELALRLSIQKESTLH